MTREHSRRRETQRSVLMMFWRCWLTPFQNHKLLFSFTLSDVCIIKCNISEFKSATPQHLFPLLSLLTPCTEKDKRLLNLRPYQNELKRENTTAATLGLSWSLWCVKNGLASFVRQFPPNEEQEMKCPTAVRAHAHFTSRDEKIKGASELLNYF